MSIKESKYIDQHDRLIMTRLSRIKEQKDRSFDIEFWQSLSDKQRMDAMWELVEVAHRLKGGHPSELRLQRSVASFKRREG
jgi:hypothetical protein